MNFFKWLFCADELAELDRWRRNMSEARRWFAGSHTVDFVLAHLEARASGAQEITGCAGQAGPRGIVRWADVRAELARRKLVMRDERDRNEAERVREEVARRACAADLERKACDALAAIEVITRHGARIVPADPMLHAAPGWFVIDVDGSVLSGLPDLTDEAMMHPTLEQAVIAAAKRINARRRAERLEMPFLRHEVMP